MLRPRKVKYNKARKIRIKGTEHRQTKVVFGEYGLKVLDGGQISSRQIEAVRRVIVRKLKRTGKVWIRIFPDVPVTAKPNEVRMGRGKGSVDKWVAVVKPGTIIYGRFHKRNGAQNALCLQQRNPMKCSFVKR